MKTRIILIALLLSFLTGCTVVGNSPMERKHRQGLPSTPVGVGLAYSNFASNP